MERWLSSASKREYKKTASSYAACYSATMVYVSLSYNRCLQNSHVSETYLISVCTHVFYSAAWQV